MKLRALASLGAAVMMVASVATTYAAKPPAPSNEANVDIVVTSTGVLSVIIEETTPFDNIEYSFEDQTVKGQLTVQVTDERGTAAGWNFNLRGTGDFGGSESGPGDSFPLSGLGLTHASTTRQAGNSSVDGITGYTANSVSTDGQQIATAKKNSGNGQYDLLFDGNLLIPGDTLVDTYSTTIVVELPSGPSSSP